MSRYKVHYKFRVNGEVQEDTVELDAEEPKEAQDVIIETHNETYKDEDTVIDYMHISKVVT